MTETMGRDDSLTASLKGLTADSRDVRPGFLFAALPGTRVDGRAFIADAITQGATAVLLPEGSDLPRHLSDMMAGVTVITDANARRRFSLMAAAFHRRQPATIAAVTGTNGKTSVASFTRQIWETFAFHGASLGTLGLMRDGQTIPGSMTTPDPVALHAGLADLAEAGVTHLAMEASSHGLHQHRLDGVRVTAAGFTNLSHDHLDYHGSVDAYLAAKTRLFTEILAEDGVAVLNADDPTFDGLARACEEAGRRVMDYGRSAKALTLASLSPQPHGLSAAISVNGSAPIPVLLPLVGAFQAHNALCAAGLVIAGGPIAGGINPTDVVSSLARLTGVRGRMEMIGRHPNGAPVYVDYAHTPDALETVLRAIRPHVRVGGGKLAVVFGCGGDRDRAKRPMMGRLAVELADRVYVTDDNPRTEDAHEIRAEILRAASGATEIGDRREAIMKALAGLEPNDTLVIAGKGHETGQIVGDVVRPFDDASVARAAIASLHGGGRSI